MSRFTIGEKSFLLENEPFRVFSGAMHYFRVPREYWRDRLLKIKACGFNTVETYTAWNLHEPNENEYDFSGMLDLKAYLELIKELNMYAIVRPGPYICSEWEFGGFPWWLLKYDDIQLRCMNKRYIKLTDRYFDKLIPIIAGCQIDNGGAVIMVQVENEYGSYGDDSEYIRYIAASLKKRGITVPLFTSDGGGDWMLTGGTVPEIFKTCNFGSDAKGNFEALGRFQNNAPLMCAEYWNGWFDHWGEKHHSRNPEDSVRGAREILELGGNISVYMAHGGTNFGYMNGANCTPKEYQPTVNSYDDDALINENGDMTPKYYLFKQLFEEFGVKNDVSVENLPRKAYGTVKFTQKADLFNNIDVLSKPIRMTNPLPMEKLGQGYGYILYKTFLRGPRDEETLYLDVHDRAYVYLDGKFAGIVYRNDKKSKIRFSVPPQGVSLSVLVENMGRVNYGPELLDRKGIVSNIRLGNQLIFHWTIYTLPFDNVNNVKFIDSPKPVFNKHPQFLKGVFNIVGEPADTFILPEGFRKGLIWVNGKLLSRYWEKGPQHTCYIPAPFLKTGENDIIMLETEGYKAAQAELTDIPSL